MGMDGQTDDFSKAVVHATAATVLAVPLFIQFIHAWVIFVYFSMISLSSFKYAVNNELTGRLGMLEHP